MDARIERCKGKIYLVGACGHTTPIHMGIFPSWDYSTCWQTCLVWWGMPDWFDELERKPAEPEIETKRTIPVRTRTVCIFHLLHFSWNSNTIPLCWSWWWTPTNWHFGLHCHGCKYVLLPTTCWSWHISGGMRISDAHNWRLHLER